MRRRAPALNEIKTRLDDEEFDALRAFRDLYGYDSDAQATRRALRMVLLGVVGILPAQIANVSVESSQLGPR